MSMLLYYNFLSLNYIDSGNHLMVAKCILIIHHLLSAKIIDPA